MPKGRKMRRPISPKKKDLHRIPRDKRPQYKDFVGPEKPKPLSPQEQRALEQKFERQRLGPGLPKLEPPRRRAREERWDYYRKELEKRFPNFFSSEFFHKLPFLAWGGEAQIRYLVLDEPILSRGFSLASDLKIKRVPRTRFVVKRFGTRPRARSGGPESQAKAMHSMQLVFNHLKEQGLFPRADFDIRVAGIYTFKSNFLVEEYFGKGHHIRADKLPLELKWQVYHPLRFLAQKIVSGGQRLVDHFEEAGIDYPDPDFSPKNIIVTVEKNRVERVWIVDQMRLMRKGQMKPRYRRKAIDYVMGKWGFGKPKKKKRR